jgi:myo-inositol-1(or 4)-monophosphatase
MRERVFIAATLESAGAYLKEAYTRRGEMAVESKGDPNDLLTEADLEVQRRIVADIGEDYPADGIVAEEAGLNRFPEDPDARAWVIDPIDGTQNFLRGLYPAFGISLAFVQGGTILAGGVLMPMTNDLFLAERGNGAFRNGQALRVSAVDRVEIARTEVDFGALASRPGILGRARRVILEAGHLRCHCAAVVGLCSIATGDMDAYVHVHLQPWDFAASQLILEEAGGRMTRLDGARLDLFGDPDEGILATNGRVHDAFLGIIEG